MIKLENDRFVLNKSGKSIKDLFTNINYGIREYTDGKYICVTKTKKYGIYQVCFIKRYDQKGKTHICIPTDDEFEMYKKLHYFNDRTRRILPIYKKGWLE